MIRKRAVKDTVNPPGQVRFGTLQQEIEEFKEKERLTRLYERGILSYKTCQAAHNGGCFCDGSCMHD